MVSSISMLTYRSYCANVYTMKHTPNTPTMPPVSEVSARQEDVPDSELPILVDFGLPGGEMGARRIKENMLNSLNRVRDREQLPPLDESDLRVARYGWTVPVPNETSRVHLGNALLAFNTLRNPARLKDGEGSSWSQFQFCPIGGDTQNGPDALVFATQNGRGYCQEEVDGFAAQAANEVNDLLQKSGFISSMLPVPAETATIDG